MFVWQAKAERNLLHLAPIEEVEAWPCGNLLNALISVRSIRKKLHPKGKIFRIDHFVAVA